MLNTSFPYPDKAEWLKRIQKDLRDTDLASLAVAFDGIDFPRFAHQDDLKVIPDPLDIKSRHAAWRIQSRIVVSDPKVDNMIALDELKGGSQSLWFVLNEDLNEQELETLFKDIIPEYIDIHWTLGKAIDRTRFLHWWSGFVGKNVPGHHSITFTDFAGSTHMDPGPSALGLAGHMDLAVPERSVKATAQWIEQLVRLLENKDWIRNQSLDHTAFIRMITPVGTHLLWETARLRATRMVLANVAYAMGIQHHFFTMDAITADPILDLHPNDHKIATPVVAFAAVAGGADGVCLPVSFHAENEKMSFHRRIARNTHHLMISESGLDKVADPAAGSYFFEVLSERIAEKCWEILQNNLD